MKQPNENSSRKVNPFLLFFTVMKDGFARFHHGQFAVGVRKHWMLYLLVLPAVALLIIFSYAPMFGLMIAFQDYVPTEGVSGSEFVGVKYFAKLFTNSSTWLVLRNTIYISIIRIATNFLIILIYTLLFNELRSKRFKTVMSTVSYLPYFISWIAVGGMCYNLFDRDGGILNEILKLFGREPVAWYNEIEPWWMILAISSLWKGMGWATLVYVSAFAGIDNELYDACEIDGGGRFRKMITVTLPGIMSVITLQLILDISSIMGDNYEQIIAMINGSQMLVKTTQVIGMMSYDALNKGSGYSTATVLGLLQGVVGTILVIVTNHVVKKTDNEGVL